MARPTAWAARTATCRRSSCMISQGTRQPDRPAALRPALGQRLPAVAVPGREVPLGRRPGAVPVEPAGVDDATRRRHARRPGAAQPAAAAARSAIPEIATRIAQYEMAFRMQTSVPELTDLSQRAASTSSSCTAPSRASRARYAANCLLARRLAERGVRFIQLFHRGWDQHTQPAQADRRPVPRHRPAVGRPGHGPEAARPARRHAGRSGAASSAAPSTARAR